MKIGKLEGLYTGSAKVLKFADGSTMTSAIREAPAERLFLSNERLEGNDTALAEHHTPDKIVHFFDLNAYAAVEERLATKLSPPTFGENFSTSGLRDTDMFVGDILAIGDAIVRITQPTERCRAVGKSLGNPKILKVLHQLQLCGFYGNVVQSGNLWRGAPITLLERPQTDWSVTRLHRFMFDKHDDEEAMEEVQALPQLSIEWKERVLVTQARKFKGEPISSSLAEL